MITLRIQTLPFPKSNIVSDEKITWSSTWPTIRVMSKSSEFLFSELNEYGLAVPVLSKPGEVHASRKSYRNEIIKFCQGKHVRNTAGLGADSVYYSKNKMLGIPGYIFDKKIHRVVFLMSWRTGAWRKVEGLRQHFIRRERPKCGICGTEENSEHLLEECPRFARARESLRSVAGLGEGQPVASLFDRKCLHEGLLSFCAVLTDYVHQVSGCEESELMKRRRKLELVIS